MRCQLGRASRRLGWAMVALISLNSWTQAASAQEETLLLQDPDVSAEHLVFVYAGDLWIAGHDGGMARRLTSDVGVESAPAFSPDGQWVAFSAQYDGNTDVYLISIHGGMPKRLTYHSGRDGVQDWHPDGKHVLFTSARDGAMSARLFHVSIEGGTPKPLAPPRVVHASYNHDASHIAYTPYADAFRTWKRYRGGRVARVWIYNTENHDTEEIPAINASDTWPCWVDGTVYFASDRDHRMNLWSYVPGSGEPKKITDFKDFDIRQMASGAGMVVLEQAGALHLYDPKNGQLKRVRIQVPNDGLAGRPRWTNASNSVRSASIAPNGKRVVFGMRGEIVTVPKENGSPRHLTESPGAHDRFPSWSPDGKSIAWFSDASGEYQLMVGDRLGREEPKAYDLDGGGFYRNPQWSPDSQHIMFLDKANRTAYLTLETGAITEVYTNQGSLGEVGNQAVWSPDGEWIAFEQRNERTMYDAIALYSVKDKSVTTITDGFGACGSPAFSHDGKHLFFTASVDTGPKLFGLDMTSSASRSSDNNLYVAVLHGDSGNPMAPKSDEGYSEKADKAKKDEAKEEKDSHQDGEKKEAQGEEHEGKDAEGDSGEGEEEKDEEEAEPSIQLEGLSQRILALPLPSSRYMGLACTEKNLLFVEMPQGGQPELKRFNFDDREAKSVTQGVMGFDVSADGKSILTMARNRYSVMSETGGNKKDLNVSSIKVKVEPASEWPQLLREAWRIERDYFYDPQMHGVDWPKMWDRWSQFLPHVRHRSDLNVLLGEMIGELACGHNYVSGGETPRANQGVSVGLLGADYEEVDGRFKFARIYQGQNWNSRLSAPLTVPGVDVREGDFLIAVNGRNVTTDDNLYEVFEGMASQQIEITVSANAKGDDSRSSTVVPIGSERNVRRLAWVEANRKRVDELSGGRLAYIYMPNTGGGGMASFDRDYYSQLDKEGLVLDERFNGGGQVADYVIHVLGREVLCYWMNREQWVAQSPFATMTGPKVMVINERAGSGGDCMPWMFKNQGIGQLVGRRTWGGLVGISGYPPLMDGGQVTAASFGVMDTNGDWAVENVGVAPDHEIVQWPKAVIEGGDPQLEKAVQLALEALEKQEAVKRPEYKPPTKR